MPQSHRPRVRADLPAERSLLLHVARAAWLALGAGLLANVHWPPSCAPEGWWDVAGAYRCSIRLADQRGWVEAALLT